MTPFPSLPFPLLQTDDPIFSLGSVENENAWAEAFAERTDRAVKILKAISYVGVWKGNEVSLTLDWKTGVWLNNDVRGDVGAACILTCLLSTDIMDFYL